MRSRFSLSHSVTKVKAHHYFQEKKGFLSYREIVITIEVDKVEDSTET